MLGRTEGKDVPTCEEWETAVVVDEARQKIAAHRSSTHDNNSTVPGTREREERRYEVFGRGEEMRSSGTRGDS